MMTNTSKWYAIYQIYWREKQAWELELENRQPAGSSMIGCTGSSPFTSKKSQGKVSASLASGGEKKVATKDF